MDQTITTQMTMDPFKNYKGPDRNITTLKIATNGSTIHLASRVLQHDTVTGRSTSHLTEDHQKDSLSIWDESFDWEIWHTILTWINVQMAELKADFKRQVRSELKYLEMRELNVFLGWSYYSACFKAFTNALDRFLLPVLKYFRNFFLYY